jgi:hypothetical protein
MESFSSAGMQVVYLVRNLNDKYHRSPWPGSGNGLCTVLRPIVGTGIRGLYRYCLLLALIPATADVYGFAIPPEARGTEKDILETPIIIALVLSPCEAYP